MSRSPVTGLVGGVATACLVAGTGGWAAMATTAALSPVVSGTTLQVERLADGSALVHVPSGTRLLAGIGGSVWLRHDVATTATTLELLGREADAGIALTYTGVRPLVEANSQVERGAVVAAVGETRASPPAEAAGPSQLPGTRRSAGAPAAFVMSVVVDGHPLDTLGVLRGAGVEVSTDASAEVMIVPVVGARVSQEFGCTAFTAEPVDTACPQGHFHAGIDLAVPRGTPVQAACGGVVRVLTRTSGYGLHVVVDHGDGLLTLYAHLETVLVADGDVVATGGLLGTVGSSGTSTGPHLHFEVRRGGVAEDPRRDLPFP